MASTSLRTPAIVASGSSSPRGASLVGAFEPGDPGFDQLMPIAETSGDGGVGALWLDQGTLRFVSLGSDGENIVLANSAVDFLRLISIGLVDLNSWDLELEPEDEDAVDALAPFREWVETEFDTTVPETWSIEDPDPFADWVERMYEAR